MEYTNARTRFLQTREDSGHPQAASQHWRYW